MSSLNGLLSVWINGWNIHLLPLQVVWMQTWPKQPKHWLFNCMRTYSDNIHFLSLIVLNIFHLKWWETRWVVSIKGYLRIVEVHQTKKVGNHRANWLRVCQWVSTLPHVPYMCRCLGSEQCMLFKLDRDINLTAENHSPFCKISSWRSLTRSWHLSSSVLTHTSRPEFLIWKCEPSVLLMAPATQGLLMREW